MDRPANTPSILNERKKLRSIPKKSKIVYFESLPYYAWISDTTARNAAMLEYLDGYGFLLQQRTEDNTYKYIFVRSMKMDDRKYN